MELKRALELHVEFFGKDGSIRVDEKGFVCLNDLNAYFPNKEIREWGRNQGTQDFVHAVEEVLNGGKSTQLESLSAVIGKKGRHKSGTYAHKWVALHFAMWLSPEFHVSVIRAYEEGTQRKADWNIKRILASNNFKLMTEAVKGAHDPPKSYHFSNEARMINGIIFGSVDGNPRDTATVEQLDAVSDFESFNAGFIKAGFEYAQRKEMLTGIYHRETKAVTA